MKTLYFDCFSGASGNMILAALIALGVDQKKLEEELRSLGVSDFKLETTNVDRSGISALHIKVVAADEKKHRHLSQIKTIIENSKLSDGVKNRATEMFTRLAEAEAKIHGIEIEKVHFHEVGAMDAIIDVVGACVGFEMLGVEKFSCSKIHVGSGFAKMAHGNFPVPPPAVAELLKGFPIYSTEIAGELCTPTGAAIISTLCESSGTLDDFEVEEIGYGAGTREYKDFPNVLRLMIGKSDAKRRNVKSPSVIAGGMISVSAAASSSNEQRSANNEQLSLIETNIDDVSPEILGYTMERAFELGALDCWLTPILMKKNRAANLISILCAPSNVEKFKTMLFQETRTLGIRVREIERVCLSRETTEIETRFGKLRVKIASMNDGTRKGKAEYEDLREAARNFGAPLIEVEREAQIEIEKLLKGKSVGKN